MSKLYNIAKKVINSESIIQAEQILFSNNGIIINSSEYYENIQSNFMQKKEIIIKKENFTNPPRSAILKSRKERTQKT